MVSESLRRIMIAARGAGELDGADVWRGGAEHPVCGDVVRVDVRVRDGAIAELAWRARGCPACVAVAAAAPDALVGSTLAAASASLRRELSRHGGLAAHERHAERLFLEALSRARPVATDAAARSGP